MPNNCLIPIIKRGEQEQWVDARTLHQFLDVGKDFSTWIKDYILDFGFVEGRDFSPNLVKSTGGRQAIEYTITIDMAKRLAMLQRNEKGMQARQYFIQAEKELRSLQAALLEGYDEVQVLLQECHSVQYNSSTWYAAAMLRRLCGKCAGGGGYHHKIKMLLPQAKAMKMPYRGNMSWYVREDAVSDILCIKPQTMIATAMVRLLKKGGMV